MARRASPLIPRRVGQSNVRLRPIPPAYAAFDRARPPPPPPRRRPPPGLPCPAPPPKPPPPPPRRRGPPRPCGFFSLGSGSTSHGRPEATGIVVPSTFWISFSSPISSGAQNAIAAPS